MSRSHSSFSLGFEKARQKLRLRVSEGVSSVRYLSSVSSCSFLLSSLSVSLSLSLYLSLQSSDSLYHSPSRLKSIPVTFIISKCDHPPSANAQSSAHPQRIAFYSLFLVPNHESRPNLRRGSPGVSQRSISHLFTPLTPSTDSDALISTSETCPLGSPNTCSQRSSLSLVQFSM